jgi:hypothetical protein
LFFGLRFERAGDDHDRGGDLFNPRGGGSQYFQRSILMCNALLFGLFKQSGLARHGALCGQRVLIPCRPRPAAL